MTQRQYIHVTTGREGPHHDPYGFVEVTFQKLDGTRIVAHHGLVSWLRINSGPTIQYCDETGAELDEAFKAAAGLSLAAAMTASARIEDAAIRHLSRTERERLDHVEAIESRIWRNAE